MENQTFSYSMDGEMFMGEAFPSREAALAAGTAEALNEPRTVVYTGRHEDPAKASSFVPSASDFLVYAQERACDEIGECAEDWLTAVTDEQEAQVQVHLDAIAALIQAFDPPHFHLVVEIETHKVPEA